LSDDKGRFIFEDLDVWQEAVEFADECIKITEQIAIERRHYRLVEQMESACASIAQNIAEGKGRYSRKEFAHFLYIARGSLFESVTLLTIFNRRKWISDNDFQDIKIKAAILGKRINALINSIKAQ
jgi:four helix bundle protein